MDGVGKVYLVGAGPGDPELITQKGLRLLQTCDVVIYDRLASIGLLKYLKEDCVKINVGKIVGNHAINQEEINRIIVEQAKLHKRVVRLKGGDPFVFGRGGEEILTMEQHGIPYEVVPGITSSIAVPAYAGIPVTHRGASQSFSVVTGHTAEREGSLPEDFKHLAKLEGTLVILMGVGNLEKIAATLMEYGRPPSTPVAVVANGTTIWQEEARGTLQDICQRVKEADIKAPAVIIVGDVAAVHFRSKEEFALSGIKVGVTGTPNITDKLQQELEGLGAAIEVISQSTLQVYKDNREFDEALKSIEAYRWLVFTSTNAVELCFGRWKELQLDFRRLAKLRFAVVGKGTEEALLKQGFRADFLPSQANAVALAKELGALAKQGGDRLLIPRAEQGSEELASILEENSLCFDDIKIYDIQEADRELLPDAGQLRKFDYLTFASASGVHGLLKGMSEEELEQLKAVDMVCIGEATGQALEEYGFVHLLMAHEASASGMVQRILESVQEKERLL
ncbi:MAG TPA: uroporphyrinogen-III C-methyltransferase [Clostridiales bacterium]|nr:uroporphyrinogen-III C-methyltransferase [Clostridiales bacterium]